MTLIETITWTSLIAVWVVSLILMGFNWRTEQFWVLFILGSLLIIGVLSLVFNNII